MATPLEEAKIPTTINFAEPRVCNFVRQTIVPLLLANLLQSSKRSFSRGSFPSFFAFKDDMLDTQILALRGSPTVTHDQGSPPRMKIARYFQESIRRFFKTPPQLSPNPGSALDRNGDQAGELVKHEIIPSSQREFFAA
jgi:hypothetical protein